MTRALVYLDPWPRGAWAVSAAALLPRLGQWSLVLVATVEDARRSPSLVEDARARLGGAGELREVLRPGPAESAVLGAAAEEGADLLVVPPAGRNAIQRMLKGSRVATVVRRAAAPVLVARRPPAAFARLLVAVAGRQEAPAAAGAALARAWGAAAAAVHVVSEVALPARGAPVGESGGDEARPAAERVAAAHGLGLTVREGLVADVVLEEVRDGAFDLLVLGSPSGAPVWGRDEVAERILIHCPVSTLIVPAEGLRLPGPP